MRLWLLFFFALVRSLPAGEGPAPSEYPLWDGQETVAQYASRVNLPPTETLDLGHGVKLDLVLIPAGQFTMGTPKPEEVDEVRFHQQVVLGQSLLALGGGVLLVLLGAVVVQAIRKRSRPKYSLARLLAMTVAAGVAVLSGMHWWHSVQTLGKAQAEYLAAVVRYGAASPDEKPAHPVTLTRPFYMGKFEVRQVEYQSMIGVNPSHFKGKDNPVENVSWDDAQEFCKRLSMHTKRTVRLSTEAEWEYSCRAGTKTSYHSGDTDKDLDCVAWCEANSKKTTHPVGQKEPNVFGLCDMLGNVWEWCQDWYDFDYTSESLGKDPQGPTQGVYRALRGGNWRRSSGHCRAVVRYWNLPDNRGRSSGFGFRVVVEPASRTP